MYKRVLRYLRYHRVAFFSALLCMVLFGATDCGLPLLVKLIADGLFADRDHDKLILLPAAIMGLALIRAITDFGQQFLIASVGHRVTEDIRNDVNRHVLSLSPDFFDTLRESFFLGLRVMLCS